MIITNEPVVPGQPVKFKVSGFPEETAVRSSVERFYGIKTDASRDFNIFNSFDEQIFSGRVNNEGKVEILDPSPRPGKNLEKKPQ
jgi:hypothetical protein